jgi:DNA-binding SARP family transcriptional activator
MHDYRAAVLRVAALDESFRRLLAHLPGAPAGLGESPGFAPSSILPAAGGPRRADLTVRFLGPIEVHRDADGKIPASAWTLRRALQIFCLVASSRGRRASKDRIVDALWGEARPSVIEKNFHPTISFLRRALNFGHNVPKNFVLYEGGAYLLNPVYTYELDIEEFESRLRAARAAASKGDGAEACVEFSAALALYRGPFLEDEYDDWSEAPRTRYASLYVAALKDAGTLHLGAEDPDEAIALFEKLVGCDPLDEEASGLLMKAFGRRGNRAGVEKEFHRLTVALKKEMSASPLPQTRRIYEESRGRAASSK